jgi:hypothetical protein
MKRILLILLPGCGCMFTEDNAVGVGRFLMPDELTVGYGYGRFDGEIPRTTDFDTEVTMLSLSWHLTPREVRVINETAAPREWYEPKREPLVSTDEEGNAIVTIPRAAGATLGTTALALATVLIRRRRASTPESE